MRNIMVVVIVSVILISMTRASCPPGRFGDSCLYSCNCGTSCDQKTGVCPGVCDKGWVKGGELCQKKNIAYNKHASSSKIYLNWLPKKAVDGDNDIHGESKTCFHGDFGTSDWTVDLGREYLLHDIRVYLRYAFKKRIVNSFIYFDNNPSSICYTFPSVVSNITNPMDLVCSTTARSVTIKNPGTGAWDESPLNICEVEIYTCSNGTYGKSCTEFCHCSGCNQWSGNCSGDCRPGWKGESCDTACDSTYGINCAKRCEDRHCVPGSPCDRYTGLCETGCQPGWKADDCTEKCDSYHYGINCSSKCSERNCLSNSTCFHETGSCDNGCKAGWQGQDCKQECNKGLYGLTCSRVCDSRQCSKPSNCNHTTGECIGGCKERWAGTDCTACDDNHFRENCSRSCSERKCAGNSSCDRETGRCETGCIDGWEGDDCSMPCDENHYSENCSRSCSERKCVGNSSCDRETGRCETGCIDGWEGDDCSRQMLSTGLPSLDAAAIAGAVCGTLVLAGLVVILVVVVRKRRAKEKPSEQEANRQSAVVYSNAIAELDKSHSSDKRPAKTVEVATIMRKKEISESKDDREESEIEETDDELSNSNAGKYYNLDDVKVDHVIAVSQIEVKVKDMEKNPEKVLLEFESLPDGFLHPYDESQKPGNKEKNRFKGYYPYNHNRVILNDDAGADGNNYINASYMDGYKSEKKYIAAQGPYRSHLVVDFWRMLWQEGCHVVVMVTGLVESGKVKCLRYWPEEENETYGHFTVTKDAENRLADYTITKLSVSHDKDNRKRQILHFHFTNWPDHGVPDTSALLNYMWRVQSMAGGQHGPIVVHCSAGIGRTGTYIAVESLIEKATTEGIVDVVGFVSSMRNQRKNMIQTKEQYHFIYRALALAFSIGDTSLDAANIKDIDLTQVGSVTMGNKTVQRHVESLGALHEGIDKSTDTLVTASYRNRRGFFVISTTLEVEELWNQVYNSGARSLITWSGEDGQYIPSSQKPIETDYVVVSTRDKRNLSKDGILYRNEIKSKIYEQDASTMIHHYHLTGSERELKVSALVNDLLTWSGQPECGSTSIVSKSLSETRLLILQLNIASRLKDDGKVDVISDMRRLQSQLAGPPFTVNDVRLCIKFAQHQLETLGVYANL